MPDQPVSLREQKKEETRRALSRAAAELLLTVGSDGMTVAAVAGKAGVSTRTFHNYFPRREDALITFIEDTVDDWRAQVEQAPDGEHPLATMQRLITDRLDDTGAGAATEHPGSLLDLMSIGDHLSYVTGPEDRDRVRHLADGLLDALYRRPGHGLSRQAVALLMVSSLAAGAIAVEVGRRDGAGASAGDATGRTSGCLLPPWAAQGDGDDGTPPDPATVLDEQFAVLRSGFGG